MLNLLKMHERFVIVQEARREIGEALLNVMKKHDLTLVETLQILHEEAGSSLKFLLRIERHPDDPTQPADIE